MRDGRMHQTTVRFGADLWAALEAECGRLGVSAAQYLREAALARLAYTAGRVGSPEYESALVAAGAPNPTHSADTWPMPTDPGAAASPPFARGGTAGRGAGVSVGLTVDEAVEQRQAASALGAQNELAIRRSREVREQARSLRQTITRSRR